MFENIQLSTLQEFWWIIISLFGAVFIILMCINGGSTLFVQLSENKKDKNDIINLFDNISWITIISLLLFVVSFYVAFPLFFSTSFSGAYWLWGIIIISVIFQIISFEFRNKSNNFIGEKSYNIILFICGITIPFFFGVLIGTFFSGSEFIIHDNNLSQWIHQSNGLEAVVNINNILLGISFVFLSRVMACLYINKKNNRTSIINNTFKQLKINSILFIIVFVIFLIQLFFKEGYNINIENYSYIAEKNKYLRNIINMPIISLTLIIGFALILLGLYRSVTKKTTKYFLITALGILLLFFSLFIITGFNNTPYYPSNFDPGTSLSIYNSSSSYYSLKILSCILLVVPLVLFFFWRFWIINRKRN